MTDTPFVAAAYIVSLGALLVYWGFIHGEARFLRRKESGKVKQKEDKKTQ